MLSNRDGDAAVAAAETVVAGPFGVHETVDAPGFGIGVREKLPTAPPSAARIWRGLTQDKAVERTREQHLAILDAITARRPELAQSWALIHVAGVEEWLRRAL
ncbi:hypothetical protein ACFQO7_17885 [Catellatospora aurea]|uniref:FCD domain-containing protein n=1 Tax=Catellatospora aurea TaxID=1337874 RepID=A0ABW2GWK5_9ACTN